MIANINSNETDTDTDESAVSDVPTFEPRSAFAWTLRSGEIARREQNRALKRSELARVAGAIAGKAEKDTPARYASPTFDPRGAFAWTLRSGEIAGRELGRRLPAVMQQDVLAIAA